MFGYVRPCAEEMKIKEFERFRACYCGLCHELGRRYGIAGRAILNYDFVFLAMLLWDGRETCGYEFRRCLPGLCRRRCVCSSAQPLSRAAGCSVILAYWKARDGVEDDRGLRRLGSRVLCLFLRRAYKKAAGEHPEFDRQVRERLSELSALERERAASLDRPADEFARLLAAAAGESGEDGRALWQLLYHLGRIIYIADGYNDLREDLAAGRYNPVAARFGLSDARVPEDVRESVLETLMSSSRLAAAAWELLPRSYWTPVTENIIYLGIPDMIEKVLSGTFKTILRGLPKRPGRAPDRTESEI